ncbi:pyrroline-5-carboxylate reductase 3 isoform X1 [Oncorhynchus nerka]|uniref:pyrroline-5-carboxylate reductase 3 isoform X1 n=2 Tax=Oncorhynchus nerka TaxID=8023 RepID=UPI001131E45B|nr:pyrroline-5-carboxylate reductase 3 isoform X1 [Oncorhynchus nerka]
MQSIMDESETWSRSHGTNSGPVRIRNRPKPTVHDEETEDSEEEATAAQLLHDHSTVDVIIKSDPETPPEMDSNLRIGFIGAGNMAYGIAKGVLQSGCLIAGDVPPSNVKVSAPSARNFGRFQELGVAVTHSNAELVSSCDLVFVAVKPHLITTILSEITDHVTRKHIIVSVAAGVTLATLQGLLPFDTVVLRLMPNLPCLVQQGALLFSRGTWARQEDGDLLRSLLQHCGLVEEGPEAWIDIHTGLSGSGVAFVYLFAEALAEGAVKMGMPSALAHSIAAQTVLGAGQLLRDSGKHPAQLRSEVCTPGGTTIFGLHAMEQGGVRAATMTAVETATERARELGRKSVPTATENRK